MACCFFYCNITLSLNVTLSRKEKAKYLRVKINTSDTCLRDFVHFIIQYIISEAITPRAAASLKPSEVVFSYTSDSGFLQASDWPICPHA